MHRSVATPIMITNVVLARASAAQSRVEPGSPGGSVPGDHGEALGELPMGQRDAGQRRSGERRGHPGDHRDRDAGGGTGLPLLAAAAEDEVVPALEPTTVAPASACSTSISLIRSCGVNAPRGILATSMITASGPRLVERGQRGQPVADDHVGVADRVPARPGSTGPGRPDRRRPRSPGRGRSAASAGRRARRGGEHAAPASQLPDLLILVGITVAVTRSAVPCPDPRRPAAGVRRVIKLRDAEIADRGADVGADHGDQRAGVQQPRDRSQGGRAAAADQHAQPATSTAPWKLISTLSVGPKSAGQASQAWCAGFVLLVADRLHLEGAVLHVEVPAQAFAEPVEHLAGSALG